MAAEHLTTKLTKTSNITFENIPNSCKTPKTLYALELLYALNLLLIYPADYVCLTTLTVTAYTSPSLIK